MNRASEDLDMNHPSAAAVGRSASEIMTEARCLQARHAPRVLGAAARRLRDVLAHLGGEPGTPDSRRLPIC